MKRFTVFLGLSVLCLAQPAMAEDLNQVFAKVNEYVAQKNYPKAMEELSWAERELQKLHQGRIAELLPADVNGFKGSEPNLQSALGFTNIERSYTSGEKSIQVSITGGGDSQGLGGLAGLAKMGMMMGGVQAGRDQFRIDGRTATLDTTSGDPEITVFLDSGSMMQIRGQSGVDAAATKKFAEALKIGDLDNYLKGAAK